MFADSRKVRRVCFRPFGARRPQEASGRFRVQSERNSLILFGGVLNTSTHCEYDFPALLSLMNTESIERVGSEASSQSQSWTSVKMALRRSGLDMLPCWRRVQRPRSGCPSISYCEVRLWFGDFDQYFEWALSAQIWPTEWEISCWIGSPLTSEIAGSEVTLVPTSAQTSLFCILEIQVRICSLPNRQGC